MGDCPSQELEQALGSEQRRGRRQPQGDWAPRLREAGQAQHLLSQGWSRALGPTSHGRFGGASSLECSGPSCCSVHLGGDGLSTSGEQLGGSRGWGALQPLCLPPAGEEWAVTALSLGQG